MMAQRGGVTMSENKLRQIRVAILATQGFEEAELIEPRKALDGMGPQTVVIAPASGQIRAMKHDEKADSVNVDLALNKANPENFDAVLISGGAMNADALRVSANAQEFVRVIDQAKKPIAVVCHGRGYSYPPVS
jgi:protease I